jgi:hypothetical protein
MLNVPETRPEADVMELVNGIIIDVQSLITQQLALIQHEFKGEIERIVDAGSLVAAGLAVAVTGGGLLCVMLVHLLARLAPALPLWGCYGIVGVPVATLGGVLCLAGIRTLKHLNAPTDEFAQNREEKFDG